MNIMRHISIKDFQLLYWLDGNSRATNKELGKKIRLTEQAVGYKIRQLEAKGIIKKFVTFINTVALGYTHYRVFLKLYNVNEETETAIISSFMENHNIRWVATVSGRYDISFSVLARNPTEFLDIYGKVEREHGKYFIEKNILINVHSPGFTREYLVGRPVSAQREYGPLGQQQEINLVDERILKSISQNSRKNIIDIARETNITVDVVKYRLKKLKEQGIISGFTIQINLEKIGYELYSLLVYTSNINKDLEKSLHAFAQIHPNILFVARLLGSWEFEILLEVQNYAEFEKVLKEFRHQFSVQLRDVEILRLTKEYKYDFFPFATQS